MDEPSAILVRFFVMPAGVKTKAVAGHVFADRADRQVFSFDRLNNLAVTVGVKDSSGFLIAPFCCHLGSNKPMVMSF